MTNITPPKSFANCNLKLLKIIEMISIICEPIHFKKNQIA